MIKLTLRDSANSHIYVNASQIVCFYADPNGSTIEVTKGDCISVREPPKQIQKLIRNNKLALSPDFEHGTL